MKKKLCVKISRKCRKSRFTQSFIIRLEKTILYFIGRNLIYRLKKKRRLDDDSDVLWFCLLNFTLLNYRCRKCQKRSWCFQNYKQKYFSEIGNWENKKSKYKKKGEEDKN